MKVELILRRRSLGPRVLLGFSLVIVFMLAAGSLIKRGQANSTGSPAPSGQLAQHASPAAADTCAAATLINPGSLPFIEEASLAGAGNDIDPGGAGCAPGGGNDVVYSFTPASSGVYTIGVTPTDPADLSLYVITDCSNPSATCIAGSNAAGFNQGESVTPTLTAGTRYFVVVDTPTPDANAAGFHFSLRRGRPANDTCATATVIDTSRLPFSTLGTTFGAANDLDPGTSCFTQVLSTRGGDVVYQFTPADTQLYIIEVVPSGNFDTSLYVTTDCSTIAGCISADVGGSGATETIRHSLNAGTTYFIVVDGFGGDAGDFLFSLTPSMSHAPVAPSDLTATAVSSTQVNLAWKDNSGDEQGFRIERSLDGFNFGEIGTVGPNVTAFSDTNAFADTIFFYRVFAFNDFGNSEPSNIAFAQTPPNPIPVNPKIVVDPASLDFGSVRVTQSATKTVTVTNGGQANLIISAISDPSGPFTIVGKPALPVTLTTTQSIALNVKFSPIVTGPITGAFTISSNDPNSPFTNVSLAGIGATAPVANLEVSPGLIDFGTGVAPVTLQLTNTGEADLLITSIIPPSAPFTLSGSAAGTLKTGEKRTLTVNFSPSSLGVFTSGITIVSNDPDSLLTFIPVKGTSLAQTIVPKVVGLQFKKQGLRFQASGSNVVAGAVLIVDNAQTFALDANDTLWVVLKSTRSTPGNLRIRDIFTPGSTHTVVVKNPNGGTSTPVSITV
ncbi:MAG TPA: choice-of-anchor D domain-containing protein [Blastocatellia bacterium]|nr:choice-of-anchor D domain-containing protein [Blastocatellia bacterium]